jgi:hypothetical protein
MKLLFYSFMAFLILFLGCDVVEDMLLPDWSIKECSWKDIVDQDHDSFSRSRTLVVEYKYNSNEAESAYLTVYYKGKTSPIINKYLTSWEVDGKEDIKISGLNHDQYDFEVHLSINLKGEALGKNCTRTYSDDQDLKAQNFENDVQDQ